jgi:hypothetical protein
MPCIGVVVVTYCYNIIAFPQNSHQTLQKCASVKSENHKEMEVMHFLKAMPFTFTQLPLLRIQPEGMGLGCEEMRLLMNIGHDC